MAVIERTRLQQSTFLVLFALAAYAFWRTLEPIWVPVLLGLVIAVGIYPVHARLLDRFGGKRPGLPAAVLTALVMIFALAVIAFLLLVVGHRVRELAAWLGGAATGIVSGLFTAIFIFVFTAITSYYLLLEGEEGTRWLVEIVPLPNGQVQEIVRDVRDVTRAMLFSTGLMTLYQGVTAGIGYWMFGVDSPVVWAALTGVASILPAVGTAIVWAPVCIVLAATGHVAKSL